MTTTRPTRPVNPRELHLNQIIRHGDRDLTIERISLEADAVEVAGRPVERPTGRRHVARYVGDDTADLVATDGDIATIRNDLEDWVLRRDGSDVTVTADVVGSALAFHVGDWEFTVLTTAPPTTALDDTEPF